MSAVEGFKPAKSGDLVLYERVDVHVQRGADEAVTRRRVTYLFAMVKSVTKEGQIKAMIRPAALPPPHCLKIDYRYERTWVSSAAVVESYGIGVDKLLLKVGRETFQTPEEAAAWVRGVLDATKLRRLVLAVLATIAN